jgi:hypothetical protein
MNIYVPIYRKLLILWENDFGIQAKKNLLQLKQVFSELIVFYC